MTDDISRTWLRFDDCECTRCRRRCGAEGEPVYVYPQQGLVCVECHEAAVSAEGTEQ